MVRYTRTHHIFEYVGLLVSIYCQVSAEVTVLCCPIPIAFDARQCQSWRVHVCARLNVCVTLQNRSALHSSAYTWVCLCARMLTALHTRILVCFVFCFFFFFILSPFAVLRFWITLCVLFHFIFLFIFMIIVCWLLASFSVFVRCACISLTRSSRLCACCWCSSAHCMHFGFNRCWCYLLPSRTRSPELIFRVSITVSLHGVCLWLLWAECVCVCVCSLFKTDRLRHNMRMIRVCIGRSVCTWPQAAIRSYLSVFMVQWKNEN